MTFQPPELPCPRCGCTLQLLPNDTIPDFAQISCKGCNLHAMGRETEEAYDNLRKQVQNDDPQCMFNFREGHRCLEPAAFKSPSISEDGSYLEIRFCKTHTTEMLDQLFASKPPLDVLKRVLSRWVKI